MRETKQEFNRQRARRYGMFLAKNGGGKKQRRGEVLPPGVDTTDLAVAPPQEVVDTLDKIKLAKEERKRGEIVAKLEVVQDRVKVALGNVGFETELHSTLSEEQALATSLIQDYDSRKKRLEKAHKQTILETIHNYSENVANQKDIMGDVSDWLSSNDSLLDGCSTKEEMDKKEKEYKEVFKHVEDALSYTADVTEQIRSIGFVLLREAGYLESDDEEEAPQAHTPPPPRKDGKEVVDDNMMLADTSSFQWALAEIRQILEQNVRQVRRNQEKQVVRFGLKQYKYIMKAVDAQIEMMASKDAQRRELEAEIESLTQTKTTYKNDLDKSQNKAQNLEQRLTRLQAQQQDLKVANVALLREIEDLKDQREAKEEEFKKRRLSVIPDDIELFRARSSIHEKPQCQTSESLLKATESAINAATKELQDELDEHKMILEQQTRSIRALEKQLIHEKQEKRKLNVKLEAKIEVVNQMKMAAAQHKGNIDNLNSQSGRRARSPPPMPPPMRKSSVEQRINEEMMLKVKTLQAERDDFEQQITSIMAELHRRQDFIEHQERRISDLREQLGVMELDDLKATESTDTVTADLKRTMMRMQRDFELEINRLTVHIDKEKQRHDAALRKQDLSHKDQLQGTYKQSFHLLRAINRFKEGVGHLLEREGLLSEAQGVQMIKNLPVEEIPSDPRMMLTQMAGLAVELLVTVEFTLSQALMNKRLEVKDSYIAKNTASKDLELQTEVAAKSRLASETILEKLKQVQSKLAMAEATLAHMKRMEDTKHAGIADRYRKLLGQYMVQTQAFDKLQKEFRDSNKHKDRALRSVLGDKRNYAHVVEEQRVTISKMDQYIKKMQEAKKEALHLNISTQRDNLDQLNYCLQENIISKRTHTMMLELIRQAMELPHMKLRFLFQRYISHRRYLDVKEEVAVKLSDPHIEERERDEVKAIVTHAETQIHKVTKDCKANRKQLEMKRVRLFDTMNFLFNELILDTGLYHSEADSGFRAPPTSEHRTPVSTITPLHTPDGATDTSGYCSGTEKLPGLSGAPPPEIRGTSVPLSGARDPPVWELPTLSAPSPTATVVEVPRILDLEVNERMRAAKRALHRAKLRQHFPVASAQVMDYGKVAESVLPVHDVISHHGNRHYGGLARLGYGSSGASLTELASRHEICVTEGARSD